jgi:hypothetical protein
MVAEFSRFRNIGEWRGFHYRGGAGSRGQSATLDILTIDSPANVAVIVTLATALRLVRVVNEILIRGVDAFSADR